MYILYKPGDDMRTSFAPLLLFFYIKCKRPVGALIKRLLIGWRPMRDVRQLGPLNAPAKLPIA